MKLGETNSRLLNKAHDKHKGSAWLHGYVNKAKNLLALYIGKHKPATVSTE